MSPNPSFQELLERFVQDGVGPGFQGVVFNRDGIVYEGAAGISALAGEGHPARPMESDTIFWIASCTKVAISIVLLLLLERGAGQKIGLTLDTLDDHEALTRILPEFSQDSGHKVTQILVGFSDTFDKDGKRVSILRPAKEKVTLRHLLTHSAGIAYDFADPHLSEYFHPTDDSTPNAQPTSATGLIAGFDVPKADEAGKTYNYGHSTDWLGQVIVRLAGVNLRQALIDHLLAPLGISTSQIDVRPSLFDQNNRSSFFIRGDSTTTYREIPLPVYEPESDDPPRGHAYYASACLYSSSTTFARILQAVLSHDERLLSESTWRLAEADNTTAYEVRMPYPNMRSYNSTLSCTIDHYHDFAPEEEGNDYTTSAGVNLLQAIVARKATRSGLKPGAYAWAGLGNTFWFIDPESGVGAVMGTQLLPFCDPQLIAARNEWEHLVTSTHIHVNGAGV